MTRERESVFFEYFLHFGNTCQGMYLGELLFFILLSGGLILVDKFGSTGTPPSSTASSSVNLGHFWPPLIHVPSGFIK